MWKNAGTLATKEWSVRERSKHKDYGHKGGGDSWTQVKHQEGQETHKGRKMIWKDRNARQQNKTGNKTEKVKEIKNIT